MRGAIWGKIWFQIQFRLLLYHLPWSRGKSRLGNAMCEGNPNWIWNSVNDLPQMLQMSKNKVFVSQ